MMGDRLSAQLSFEGLKLAAATVLLSPHVPLLFMGEEYGEKHPFRYFVSHSDSELLHQIREGRRREFSHFGWEGEIPDPAAEETFRACILSGQEDLGASELKLLEYYRFLIRFRQERKALQGRERHSLNVLGTYGKLIAIERIYEDDYLLILLNFGDKMEEFRVELPFELNKLDDSSSGKWNGPNGLPPSGNFIPVNPVSAVIYERR